MRGKETTENLIGVKHCYVLAEVKCEKTLPIFSSSKLRRRKRCVKQLTLLHAKNAVSVIRELHVKRRGWSD